MKRLLLAAACCVLAVPAFAWNNTQTGGPNVISDGGGQAQAQVARGGRGGAGGNASATGGSATAHGGSARVVNRISVPSGGSGPSSGGSNTTTLNYPRQVPTVVAPSVFGGACTGNGGSGGLTTGLFGVAFGANRTDRICQLHTIGRDDVAFHLLCQDSDIRQAASAAGEPCDTPVPPVPPAANAVYWQDYCATRNKGDRNQHLECDREVRP